MAKSESSRIPCCPDLIKDDNCDVLFFTRTLDYPFNNRISDVRATVQLILSFKFSRCTLGLALGDPAYTTTLLPGEKVKIFTSDRRSRYSYDASTKLVYREEQMSEEQFFMTATQHYYADIENNQSGNSKSTGQSNWDFKGNIDGGLTSPVSANANSSAKGSYNSTSALEYIMSQSSHMRTAASQAANATRMAHSISVGEVSSTVHIEGQSEEKIEVTSREFSNENNCHAVTYIFYRLNKKQVIKFELLGIQESISIHSASNEQIAGQQNSLFNLHLAISKALRSELIAVGILDKDGNVSSKMKANFNFEMQTSLPTAGIQVKGCLDDCTTCEPERERYHKLKNDLLAKQIDLLEKSQEYRCCPPSPTVNNV